MQLTGQGQWLVAQAVRLARSGVDVGVHGDLPEEFSMTARHDLIVGDIMKVANGKSVGLYKVTAVSNGELHAERYYR